MIKIALTGVNGYGAHFIPSLLEKNEDYELTAVVSRNAKKSEYYEELLHNQVKLYTELEQALHENKIDLVILATPMFTHYEEVMMALQAGAHVYCEKPLAPTIEQCMAINEEAKRSGRIVAVGFQWSFSKGIQELKHDLLSGTYGTIQKMKTIASWSRPKRYFEESSWKGKMVLPDGSYLLESVMSNCAVHFLHNLFYLCGKSQYESASLSEIEGEGYQGYDVQGYDTVMLRMKTKEGVLLHYYATMLAEESKPAKFEMTLTDAVVSYPAGDENKIEVCRNTGEKIYYDCPDDGRFVHYKDVVQAIKENKRVACEAEATFSEVIAVNIVAETIPPVRLPKEMLWEDKSNRYAYHMDDMLAHCYTEEALPKELYYSLGEVYRTRVPEGYAQFSGLFLEKRNNLEN